MLGLAETLVDPWVSTWPPNSSSPEAEVLLEWVDPAPIGVDMNVVKCRPVTPMGHGEVGLAAVCFDVVKALPCIVLLVVEIIFAKHLDDLLIFA